MALADGLELRSWNATRAESIDRSCGDKLEIWARELKTVRSNKVDYLVRSSFTEEEDFA